MPSQEQISYLENVLESLKGFTDDSEVYTSSTDIQIMLEKFSKISKKEIDEENIPLLVTCCLKYVDFLLQSLKLLNTRQSRYKRHVHKYFSVLAEIGQKKNLKNRFMEAVIVPILERITDPCISNFHGRELTNTLNRIVENSDRNLRNEIVNFSARIHIYKLADLIEVCGDYEYQTYLVKALFLMCSSDFTLKYIKELFPSGKNKQQCFLDINYGNYDRNLRRFLNAVNHVNNKIFSITVCAAHLDEYSIEPPKSEGDYNMDLWVDFNSFSKTIGIFCNKNSFEAKSPSEEGEDAWELLTFFAEDISFVELKWEVLKSEESFQLSVLFHKSAPCHYIFYKTAKAASANILKLIIQDEVVNELMDVLLNMFGGKFEAFKEMSQNSQVSAYYTPELTVTPESVTVINHVNKICVSCDSRSERSYANALLCRNVEDAEDNHMSVQNITIRKRKAFTNEMVNHVEGNKENVECYRILNQEGNSLVYFNCKENEKPENEFCHFSLRSPSECIGMQNLTDSTITRENLVRNSNEAYLENKKLKKLDPNTECNHSASGEIAKPKKLRRKKQIKKRKQKKVIKTLPTVSERNEASDTQKNEMEVFREEEPKESFIEHSNNCESFHLTKETQNFTSQIIIRMPNVIVEKSNFEEYLNKDSLQYSTNCKEHTCAKIEEVVSISIPSSTFNAATEKFKGQEDLNNFNSLQYLTNDKEHSYINAEEVDDASVPSSTFNAATEKFESQEDLNNFNSLQNSTNDKEYTCTNAEEVDDASIPSFIFNVATQKFKSHDDLNKTPENFVQENNELREKKLTPVIFEVAKGKKQKHSSAMQHETNFETSSLWNTANHEHTPNETIFNQSRTCCNISVSEDLSYMEIERDASSPDSEIGVSKTIVIEAIVHEPASNTLHHKQNQIKIKKIKSNVNHEDLDSIHVIEDNTRLDKKQANFNEQVVNIVKMQTSQEKKQINLKETEALCKEPIPSNEQSKRLQSYLPNQKINLLADKNGKITEQSELFMNYFQSEIKDNKPKKGKETSSKIKKLHLLKIMPVDSFDDTGNNVDVELYIDYTSCFNKPSNRKGKSITEKSKSDNCVIKQLSTTKKRKNLDYSDKKPAKKMRVSNESSVVKTMAKAKQKRSTVKANKDRNEEISNITKGKNSEMVMTSFKTKKAKTPQVKILQNIILQPATNSIINNI